MGGLGEDRRVEMEKVDYFYKHLGDRIDRIGSRGTKDKGELQRIPRF